MSLSSLSSDIACSHGKQKAKPGAFPRLGMTGEPSLVLSEVALPFPPPGPHRCGSSRSLWGTADPARDSGRDGPPSRRDPTWNHRTRSLWPSPSLCRGLPESGVPAAIRTQKDPTPQPAGAPAARGPSRVPEAPSGPPTPGPGPAANSSALPAYTPEQRPRGGLPAPPPSPPPARSVPARSGS